MIFSLIIIAHWFGDFAFQTSNMAVNKSRSFKWLFLHTGTYTVTLLLFCLFLMPMEELFPYVVLNGLLHGTTDLFTSRLAAKYREEPRRFYPIIGFDQMVHTLTLYWTLEGLVLS